MFGTRRVTTRFEEVKLYGQKAGKCGCGKRRTRRQKFYQTINPFNVKKNGDLKCHRDIYEELKKKVVKCEKEPITCDDCAGR